MVSSRRRLADAGAERDEEEGREPKENDGKKKVGVVLFCPIRYPFEAVTNQSRDCVSGF